MRPIEFIYNIVDKFAPMNDLDRTELRRDATTDYDVWRKEANLKDDNGNYIKNSLIHKIVRVSEKWHVRTLLACVFIWWTPKIAEYMNPSPDDFDDFEDEDED